MPLTNMEKIRSSDDYKREESMLNPLNSLPTFTTSDFTLLMDFLTFEMYFMSTDLAYRLIVR